ncbi:MAG: hypothetical protein HN683_04690 [Gammaproteobacteria bacterium]|jgi:hypothetical protein|nr:hypothetical protein [Gammaproteobacteria bacterium]
MIETGVTQAAKALFMRSVLTDTCKIALFSSEAELGVGTRAYTTDYEVSGFGYKSGGMKLSDCELCEETDGSVYLTWGDVEWPKASMTAAGYMIYDTSKNNTVLFVGSWGAEYTSTNGPFKVPIPDRQIMLI